MSKLILHVGTHKTATTTIQDILALNRAELAASGLVFPQMGRASGQHGLVADWITLPPHYHFEEGSVAAWQALVRDHADSDRTVLVSTEEFSRGDPRQRVDLGRIRELCSGFDEFQVICCIRNQVSFLQSIYLQVAKTTVAVPWKRLYDRAVTQRMATGLFLDFNWLYMHLQKGFAPEEIRFFVFEQAVRRPDGIIGEVLELAGFPHLIARLKPLGAGDSNVSQDPLSAWSAAQIVGKRPASKALLDVTRKVLEQEFGKGVKTTVFSAEEKARLTRLFAPLNDTFLETIAKTGHDLTIDWPSMTGPLVHRDQVALGFWIKLSRALYEANPRLG